MLFLPPPGDPDTNEPMVRLVLVIVIPVLCGMVAWAVITWFH